MRHQKTIWVVDDIEDIILSFTSALEDQTEYCCVYVPNAKQVQAQAGDIIFLDLSGTNAPSLKVAPGVQVIRMTGGDKPAELYKPFSGQDVNKLIHALKNSEPLKKAA